MDQKKNVCILFVSLIFLLVPIVFGSFFIQKVIQKSSEHFIVQNDVKLDKNNDIDELRFNSHHLTFPNFHFHANHPGFLHIGNFLLQWGTANANPTFPLPFGEIMGVFCIPYAGNTGEWNLKYEKMYNDRLQNWSDLSKHKCERPIFYLAYGFLNPINRDTKITYSKRALYKSTPKSLISRFMFMSTNFEINNDNIHTAGTPSGCDG